LPAGYGRCAGTRDKLIYLYEGVDLEQLVLRQHNAKETLMRMLPIGFVLAAVVGMKVAQAQDAAQGSRPEFEVAAIKPSASKLGAPGGRGPASRLFPGGRWTARNASVRFLIQGAYQVRSFRIIGGPAWIDSEHFDISAKAPDDAPPDQFRLMQQALLEDRFHLMLHRETRAMPVYFLTATRGGRKLVEPNEGGCVPRNSSPPAHPGQPPPVYCGLMVVRPGGLDAAKIGMEQLTMFFSDVLGRAVIDKTDFQGTFDVHLNFARDEAVASGIVGDDARGGRGGPPPSPDSSAPSIFTAAQEQLGLRLESGKGQVEVLVVDHVERPTGN
jgi:uncharacterized protein (TIGR03435 family)